MSWHNVEPKKTYYEKVGKRYKPVAYSEVDYADCRNGDLYVTHVKPGVISRRWLKELPYAELAALLLKHEDRLIDKLRELAEPKPGRFNDGTKPISPKMKEAWEAFMKVYGEEGRWITLPAVCDFVRGFQEEIMAIAKADRKEFKVGKETFAIGDEVVCERGFRNLCETQVVIEDVDGEMVCVRELGMGCFWVGNRLLCKGGSDDGF